MPITSRRATSTGVVLVAGLVLAACGFATSKAAVGVHDVGATLTGDVGNTLVGDTTYWFEYGLSSSYGASTPTRTLTISAANATRAVEESITGLAEGTNYHYRLCARDVNGHGTCGEDRSLKTTSGRDSVHGLGTVFSMPALGYVYGASVRASSGPHGTGPNGDAISSPGTWYFKVPDSGPVTCLEVTGNRAAIGFMAQTPFPDVEPLETPRVIFVEDNGPSGDKVTIAGLESSTSCPEPTDEHFADIVIGGFPVPPIVQSGDFVVHDHP